jgi:hypothetical protein
MGFFITILYFVTYYLTPATIFGPFAAYRVQLIFAVLVTLVSLPALAGSTIWKTPQTLALLGLTLATFMSIAVGAHWVGGGISAFVSFIPTAFAYFLVCVHCNTKKRFQIIVLTMLFVCLFVIGRGTAELLHGIPTADDTQQADSTADFGQQADLDQSYFMGMRNDAGEWFYRLRGMGEINDPNDFAQVIVCVIPLLFVFWRRKRMIRNFFFVVVPVGALLWGDYLTHSRGSVIALLAVVIVATRKKIGTVPAVLVAALLFVGASATQFTGGREISTTAGEDRTALWGEGLQLLKSHPLFGVGFGQMPDYTGLTAHNTIVVCAAELGLFGLYFWSMFLLPSVRDGIVVASQKNFAELPALQASPVANIGFVESNQLEPEEINRLGRLMVLSLTGFLVAGWFLSRAYVLTLFLLGGMTEAVFAIGLRRGMVQTRLSLGRVSAYAGILTIALVVLMWIVLRIVNLTH